MGVCGLMIATVVLVILAMALLLSVDAPNYKNKCKKPTKGGVRASAPTKGVRASAPTKGVRASAPTKAPLTCVPDCNNKCGPDGCGGICVCPNCQTCNLTTNTCSACVPLCDGSSCGADGCGGLCQCPTGKTCGVDNKCSVPGCIPNCATNSCGSDGCGNACPCPSGKTCDPSTKTCVCTPKCESGSCGDDGCGDKCKCPLDQTCDLTTQKCSGSGCTPKCTSGVCGPDGCGGTCVCPQGQMCDKNNQCVVDDSKWEGWATTTQFGPGEIRWGFDDPLENLDKINDNVRRMGGAVPWKEICKFGSKQKQIEAVVKSALGKTDDESQENSCYLVQPVNAYPDQISGLSDSMYSSASNCGSSESSESSDSSDPSKKCIDVNAPELAATDSNENPFPSYLIFPYEGCGGDCKVGPGSGADCLNDCLVGDDQVPGVTCQWNDLKGPLCEPAKILYNNGKWGWSQDIENKFLQYSDVLAIGPETDYGRNIEKTINSLGEGHANFCSGKNMHIDIALTNPYWENIQQGTKPIAQTTADSNIVLRYKRVPCHYYGTVDINDDPSTGTPCPEGYYPITQGGSCSTKTLNPGDPDWLNSGMANHSCCMSGSGSNKCYGGQVYQPDGGACPCPSGQCFFNLTKPLHGWTGSCGQCGSSPAACVNTTKC